MHKHDREVHKHNGFVGVRALILSAVSFLTYMQPIRKYNMAIAP